MAYDYEDGERDDVEVAAIDSYEVNPSTDPNWLYTMDGISQELCTVAEAVDHDSERILGHVEFPAKRRRVAPDRFFILSELRTDPEHRGNRYGHILLHEVVRICLNNSGFVVGLVDAFEESSDVACAERTDSLVSRFTTEFGAEVLSGRILFKFA